MSEGLTGIDGFIDDLNRWRASVSTRAPSYHRVFEELTRVLESGTSEGADVAARVRDAWAHRTFLIFYERPLLFIAALRMEALVRGKDHPLWAALAAPDPDPSSVTRDALLASLASDSFWSSVRNRFVQTNETSRALAWLWPASIVGADNGARPLAIFEVGTAAGLNLVADRLSSPWKTEAGAALDTVRAPNVLARRGIDAHPLDASRDEHANWLRACVWAGERDRLARVEAALEAFRSTPVQLEAGDVTSAPDRLRALTSELPDAIVIAFQTIVRDYLSARTRADYESGMRAWLEASAPGRAMWTELEVDPADPVNVPVVAWVRGPSGVVPLELARTGYHPTTVRVNESAVRALARTFAEA